MNEVKDLTYKVEPTLQVRSFTSFMMTVLAGFVYTPVATTRFSTPWRSP
jgi:hypothetical protein